MNGFVSISVVLLSVVIVRLCVSNDNNAESHAQ